MRNIKKFLALLTLSFFVQGCWLMGYCLDEEQCEKYGTVKDGGSKGGCTDFELAGTWKTTDPNIFVIFDGSDCTLRGYCAIEGTFSYSSDEVTLKVSTSNFTTGSTCPQTGTHVCEYELDSTSKLTLACPVEFRDSELVMTKTTL